MKMWDGKPAVKEPLAPSHVYQGRTSKGLLISFPTEKETLIALSKAGGGEYENTLHKFKFTVKHGEYTR